MDRLSRDKRAPDRKRSSQSGFRSHSDLKEARLRPIPCPWPLTEWLVKALRELGREGN